MALRGLVPGAGIGLGLSGLFAAYLALYLNVPVGWLGTGAILLVGGAVGCWMGRGQGRALGSADSAAANAPNIKGRFPKATMAIVDAHELLVHDRIDEMAYVLGYAKSCHPEHIALRISSAVADHLQGSQDALAGVGAAVEHEAIRPRDLALASWIVQETLRTVGPRRKGGLQALLMRMREKADGKILGTKSRVIRDLQEPRLPAGERTRLCREASELSQCFADLSSAPEARAAVQSLHEAATRLLQYRTARAQGKFWAAIAGALVVAAAGLGLAGGSGTQVGAVVGAVGLAAAACVSAWVAASRWKRCAWRSVGTVERYRDQAATSRMAVLKRG